LVILIVTLIIVLYAVCLQNQLGHKEDEILHMRTEVFSVALKKYREHRICPESRYSSCSGNRQNNTIAQKRISQDLFSC